MTRAVLVAAFVSALAIATASPASAAPLPLPDPVPARSVSPYPPQMPAAGNSGQYTAPGGGLLSLPRLGDCHLVTSNCDHRRPAYAIDGALSRAAGTVA